MTATPPGFTKPEPKKRKPRKIDGICKVTKFVTEDGKEHDTFAEAVSHKSKDAFIRWVTSHFRHGHDIEEVAEGIYANWAVTKRSEPRN